MLLYSYHPKSMSGKALSRGLGIKRIKHNNSSFIGNLNKTVINWGASTLPHSVMQANIINPPKEVNITSNKLYFFRKLKSTPFLPQYTEIKEEAQEWAREHKVVCRTVLRGHSGKGIVMASTPQEVVDAPLYVRYEPKKDEYRIHVCRGEVFDVQEKGGIRGVESNWEVRNKKHGFVFMRKDIHSPACVLKVAIDCFNCFALDFGAIDVIYNERKDKALVLEINTSPGLKNTTLNNYANMIRRITNV